MYVCAIQDKNSKENSEVKEALTLMIREGLAEVNSLESLGKNEETGDAKGVGEIWIETAGEGEDGLHRSMEKKVLHGGFTRHSHSQSESELKGEESTPNRC